jgi:hypothetical protein
LLRVAHNVQIMPNDLEAIGRKMMDEAKYW